MENEWNADDRIKRIHRISFTTEKAGKQRKVRRDTGERRRITSIERGLNGSNGFTGFHLPQRRRESREECGEILESGDV